MKPYDVHVADCRTLLARRTPISMPVVDCVGYELAEAVLATSPFPSFTASSMDGYAVRVADVPGQLRVVAEVAAGQVPGVEITPGTAVRIMTGSMIPAGTEAVVRVEDTTSANDLVDVSVAVASGNFIRRIGQDVEVGDVVLAAGQIVGAAQLAALVAHNVDVVSVLPRIRVAILSTGEELVAYGEVAGPAQLVDSNGPGLAAAAAAAGAEVVYVGQVGDVPEQFLAAMDALPEVDLIITSGGISMGVYDVVKGTLASLGIRFETVAIQPGKPQAWGRYRETTGFLGLPGNPVSALVSFELFGRAMLGRERMTATATLRDEVRHSPAGMRQFLRGHLSDGQVQLVSGPDSHLVVGLARSNCLVVVDEQTVSLPAGAQVPVIVLND